MIDAEKLVLLNASICPICSTALNPNGTCRCCGYTGEKIVRVKSPMGGAKDDIQFLLDQLQLMDFEQDRSGIERIRKTYNLKDRLL